MDILSDVSIKGTLESDNITVNNTLEAYCVKTGYMTGKLLNFCQTSEILMTCLKQFTVGSYSTNKIVLQANEIILCSDNIRDGWQKNFPTKYRATVNLPDSCSKFFIASIHSNTQISDYFCPHPSGLPVVSAWKSIDWDNSTKTGTFSKVEVDYEYSIYQAGDSAITRYSCGCLYGKVTPTNIGSGNMGCGSTGCGSTESGNTEMLYFEIII